MVVEKKEEEEGAADDESVRACAAKAERQGDLVAKFAAGWSLLESELAELLSVLPAAVLANPPEPRAYYRYGYTHYAELLAVGERHIKRYVQIGRLAKPVPDFPPFDEPCKFIAWWRRRMKGEPSDRAFAFAGVAAEAAALPLSAASAPQVPNARQPPLVAPTLSFESAGAGGFEASVVELRATVAGAQQRLRRAQQAVPLDEGLVTSCNRTVREQLDLLRKAENDLFDMQRKRGELIPRPEVREDWRTLLAALQQMRRRMEHNIASALAKSAAFTAEQIAMVRAAVIGEREREDQLLRGSKYWRVSPSGGGDSDVSPESHSVA